jgi:hypothetical protein
MDDPKDEVRQPPERDFETEVSDIGTDPNATFDKDLNPVDYPDQNRKPEEEPIRQSERYGGAPIETRKHLRRP